MTAPRDAIAGFVEPCAKHSYATTIAGLTGALNGMADMRPMVRSGLAAQVKDGARRMLQPARNFETGKPYDLPRLWVPFEKAGGWLPSVPYRERPIDELLALAEARIISLNILARSEQAHYFEFNALMVWRQARVALRWLRRHAEARV